MTYKCWTLAQATEFVREHEPWFRREGWLLSIYGSVLSGAGRDLDLIAVNWRPDATPPSHMALQLGMPIQEPETSLMGARCFLVGCGGRLVDLQFRTSVGIFLASGQDSFQPR